MEKQIKKISQNKKTHQAEKEEEETGYVCTGAGLGLEGCGNLRGVL